MEVVENQQVAKTAFFPVWRRLPVGSRLQPASRGHRCLPIANASCSRGSEVDSTSAPAAERHLRADDATA